MTRLARIQPWTSVVPMAQCVPERRVWQDPSLAFALFAIKGAATYGFSVILSRIGNAIIASNQRAMFSKLMRRSSPAPTVF